MSPEPPFKAVVEYHYRLQRINSLPWHKRVVARWQLKRGKYNG